MSICVWIYLEMDMDMDERMYFLIRQQRELLKFVSEIAEYFTSPLSLLLSSLWFVMWCDVMWCDVMWCDVMWCDVIFKFLEFACPQFMLFVLNETQQEKCQVSSLSFSLPFCSVLLFFSSFQMLSGPSHSSPHILIHIHIHFQIDSYANRHNSNILWDITNTNTYK